MYLAVRRLEEELKVLVELNEMHRLKGKSCKVEVEQDKVESMPFSLQQARGGRECE